MFNFTKELISMRKSHKCLRRGLQCHIYADKDLYIFGRLLPDDFAVIIFNTSNKDRNFVIDFPFDIDQKNIKADYGDNNSQITINNQKIQGMVTAKNFAVYFPKCNEINLKNAFDSWNNQYKNENYWGRQSVKFNLNVKDPIKNSEYYLIGNCAELGNWSVDNAVMMKNVGNNSYEAVVELPIGKIFDCKCLSKTGDKTVWMSGDNIIEVVNKTAGQSVKIDW